MTEYTTVLELLSDPSRWTKYADAKDSNGEMVSPCGEQAVCWCLNGAIKKIYGEVCQAYNTAWDKVVVAIHRVKDTNLYVAGFNDAATTTHQDILDVLKEAGV